MEEEVQSWWEVPAVAHFCYIFRSPFNLFFFEIDELESALLNIQDPDMGISLEQLILRLLQGCFDKDSVNEDNWEEKLRELFNDNFEDNENPLGESYFPHLSPRSKIEVLLKLCELRLDVEGALDEIKNISAEDMQATCIGKDSQNNTYWYFCNERLYKEVSSSEKKLTQPVKSVKNDSNKVQNSREKRKKLVPNVDKSWSVVCYNISDWERLSTSFNKSKKKQDKELADAMKKHIPLLEERVAEKDRLLRKRFLELAPKRSSSRISKVQEKKKLEELKAAEEARKAELKAEKERAKKEALLQKLAKESRQKRAEERSRAIEERAERAKLRELMREDESSEEENDNRNKVNNVSSVKNQKRRNSSQFSKRKVNGKSDNDSEGGDECRKINYSKIKKKTEISKTNSVIKPLDNKQHIRTYSGGKKQSENDVTRENKALKSDDKQHIHTYSGVSKQSENISRENKAVNDNSSKFLLNSHGPSVNISLNSKQSPKLPCASQNTKTTASNDEVSSGNSCSNSSNVAVKMDSRSSNYPKTEGSSPKQSSPNLCTYSYRYSQLSKSPLPPRISIYKSNIISNTSDSKWNTAAFDSQGQKVHILYKSSDNLAPKRIKLEPVNFNKVPPNLKSSLTKENHLFKPVQFITYGKIIPPSAMVKLEFKKPPPNQPVSS